MAPKIPDEDLARFLIRLLEFRAYAAGEKRVNPLLEKLFLSHEEEAAFRKAIRNNPRGWEAYLRPNGNISSDAGRLLNRLRRDFPASADNERKRTFFLLLKEFAEEVRPKGLLSSDMIGPYAAAAEET